MAPNLQEGWGPINFILNFPRRRCIVFITSSLFQKINLLNSLHRSLPEAHSPHPDGRIPDLRLYRPCGSGQPGLGGRLQRHQVHRQQRRRLQLGLLPAGGRHRRQRLAGVGYDHAGGRDLCPQPGGVRRRGGPGRPGHHRSADAERAGRRPNDHRGGRDHRRGVYAADHPRPGDLRTFAALGLSHVEAPLFATTKKPSM
jgi:hypothetical protein